MAPLTARLENFYTARLVNFYGFTSNGTCKKRYHTRVYSNKIWPKLDLDQFRRKKKDKVVEKIKACLIYSKLDIFQKEPNRRPLKPKFHSRLPL